MNSRQEGDHEEDTAAVQARCDSGHNHGGTRGEAE